MDLLPAILGAQTYHQAIANVREQDKALDDASAWQEIGRVVQAAGWALLVAPELWLCLSRWWAIQRLGDDLEGMREDRELLHRVIREPEILTIVEMSKDDQPVRVSSDGGIFRILKTGPDILSVRVGALANLENAITKKEEALGRAEERFGRATEAYRRKLEDIADLTPIQQTRRLLTMHLEERDLTGARALVETMQTARKALESSGDEVCANVDAIVKRGPTGA